MTLHLLLCWNLVLYFVRHYYTALHYLSNIPFLYKFILDDSQSTNSQTSGSFPLFLKLPEPICTLRRRRLLLSSPKALGLQGSFELEHLHGKELV